MQTIDLINETNYPILIPFGWYKFFSWIFYAFLVSEICRIPYSFPQKKADASKLKLSI